MKTYFNKSISVMLAFLLLSLLTILFIGQSTFSFSPASPTTSDFSNVIELGITDKEVKVVDVAMLGAHDAFSTHIKYESQIDPGEESFSLIRNKFLTLLGKGAMVRYTKAQLSLPQQLLVKGVRYFDVRLSYVNDTWMTKHSYLSANLEVYLNDIIQFLIDHPKEMIIFDIQHCYVGDSSYDQLFDFLGNYTHKGKSLLDFVHYDSLRQPLESLSVNDVITDQGGVVILAKYDISPQNNQHYNYWNSIRSIWHNKNNDMEMFAGIRQEYDYLSDLENFQEERNRFRVNQAQKTAVFDKGKTLTTLQQWSLLDMASKFNYQLLDQEDFTRWFTVMPILMVDYADTTYRDFNDKVNTTIIEFNKQLSISN